MTEHNAKTRVRHYLEDRGLEDIIVKTRLFAGGRDVLTFDVEYITPNGTRRKISRVVHTSMFSNGKIYWQQSFEKDGTG